MKPTRWSTILALLLAIWFALSSWMWFWILNVFISFPFGLAALILYFIGRHNEPGNKLNRIVLIILAVGLSTSVLAIVFWSQLSKSL